MAERARKFDPTQSSLLLQAADIQAAADSIAQDEAEAAEQVPILKKRIDDFVLKLFPKPKESKSSLRKSGEKLSLKEIGEIGKRVSDEARGMKVECEVPLGNNTTKVTITRGTSYYDMFDPDQDLRVNVEALPDVLVFGQRTGASIESKARNSAEFTMHTPIGPSMDRGPVSRRKVRTSDIADYSGLFDVLKSPRVKKTATRFHQQRP